MDEELRASLLEGSVGEVVREFAAEAYAKAYAEAYARGAAKSVLRVVDKRGVGLTAEQREHVLGCTDLETLTRWLDAAIDAKSADEIFA